MQILSLAGFKSLGLANVNLHHGVNSILPVVGVCGYKIIGCGY